jgi:hypothetical protein
LRPRDILLGLSAGAAFGLGLAGFLVVRPPGGAPLDFLHALYQTIALYVVNPPARGLPAGEPTWAVSALWVAHFLAPLSLATVVVDACLLLLERGERSFARRQGHTIVSGIGRTAILCVEEIVRSGSARDVVVVELYPDNAHLPRLRALGVGIVMGSMKDEAALRRAGIEGARAFLALSEDDILNINAATLARRLAGARGFQVFAQVIDAKLHQNLPASLKAQIRFLNTHEVAADALIRERRIAHGYEEAFVIAGFGNFGQMVLKALLREDADLHDRFFVLDRDAEEKVRSFLETFDVEGRDVRPLRGNLHDPALWRTIRDALAAPDSPPREPLVLVCTDNDVSNLSLALSIRRRWVRSAAIHCRMFGEVSFEQDMVRGQQIETYRVADLLRRSLPPETLGQYRRV